MKKFMDKDFLLETDTAKNLFHNTAAKLPIIDYHCHLVPGEIATNKQFSSITEMWLGGDHYKWRQMRTYGISEEKITGNADPYEKFLAWAETIEHLIGNPLYHWTHLELQRYFGITEPLTRKSAPTIWKEANKKLSTPELSVKGIFNTFNVYAVGTTDDPIDDLAFHSAVTAGKSEIGKINTKVIPSFRPDKAVAIENDGFCEYIEKLAKAASLSIKTFDDVVAALDKRLDFFIAQGCKASDHALQYPPFVQKSDTEVNEIFQKRMEGNSVSDIEAEAYRTSIMIRLSSIYAKKHIAMQLHFAVIRSVNKTQLAKLGPDTGFDTCADEKMATNLAKLLNAMNEQELPKTILYTLNPKDYYPMTTIMGAFQGGCKGKVQLGSAWWFLDHKDGMEQQMKILGNTGMLSAFVGMLTDSRSFMSYPRHEYFRRILCNLVGKWVENGEYPNDNEFVKTIIADICFNNAQSYFDL